MKRTTISFHVDNDEKIARLHNRRDPSVVQFEEHIDPEGHYEIWLDKGLEDAYEEIFGKAIEEYNKKQKRKDRRIDGAKGYMEMVRNDTRGNINKKTKKSGKHLAYEVIVRVGSLRVPKDPETGLYMKGSDGGYIRPYIVPESVCYDILREYYEEWAQNNPNLALLGAYYHADEAGVPHLHIDFIPVATGYERGMSIQNSIGRALEQQGYESEGYSKGNSYIKWQEAERERLEAKLKALGYEIEHPDKGTGKEALSHQDFKAQQDLLKRLDEIQEQTDNLTLVNEGLNLQIKMKTKQKEDLQEDIDRLEEYIEPVKALDNVSTTIDGLTILQQIKKRYQEEEELQQKAKRKAPKPTAKIVPEAPESEGITEAVIVENKSPEQFIDVSDKSQQGRNLSL